MSEALRMRNEGAGENKLVSLLTEDPDFKAVGITIDEIKELIDDKTWFVGNAERQIDAVKKKAHDLLTRYSDEAMYEPREIL